MLLLALGFLIGVMLVQQLAVLPSMLVVGMPMLVLGSLWLACGRLQPRYRQLLMLTLFILAGAARSLIQAQDYLEHRLPETAAGKDVQVTGRISGIPSTQGDVQRFFFDIEAIDLDTGGPLLAQRLRLSWYHGERVRAGERWSFRVRLKPPHGFFNAGGFDYEAWLYQRGVHATGYIRSGEHNLRLAPARWWSIDKVREGIGQFILQALDAQPHAGLVMALAIGERSHIPSQQWQQLIATGTNHLMAISGLHIGLAAGFAYWLCRRLCPAEVMKRLAVQRLGLAAGMLLALLYALLAGLSVPTQRALLMLVCCAGGMLAGRHVRPLDTLALALFAVLLFDPVATLAAGFWFSFAAVAVIFYLFIGRWSQHHRWRQWGGLQLAIALALCPLSLLMFQQASLVSPLANSVLVPYVSFTVVPLVLVSMLCLPFNHWLAEQALWLAGKCLEWIWPGLQWLSHSEIATLVRGGVGPVETLLALLGVLLLLAPRGVPARWLGLLLLAPLLMQPAPSIRHGDFVLDLLDVGQGLAAVVRTAEHTLVFDTGARFSERLDAGEAVVVPFLRQQAVDRVDRIVISHGDADHIGGAESVLAAYPAEVVGQDIESLAVSRKRLCADGMHWRWDDVDFEFLHPDARDYARRNNRSCVLRISGAGGSLLLTGDIERTVESALISRAAHELAAEVLVVPHHGSQTSSSPAFIRAVSPQLVLFPAGYRNRYRFPHQQVMQRYHEAGARLMTTGQAGAIRVVFDAENGLQPVRGYRQTHAGYWNHRPPPAVAQGLWSRQ